MPLHFEPKTSILPAAQRQIWPQLAPTVALSFVLYGGTAVALHLGHRRSLDFDFFSAAPLTKRRIKASFSFMKDVDIVQEEPDTLVIAAKVASNRVKISFFGNLGIGHVNEPLLTTDGVLRVASLDDLMATKLKATLDRAEAKDYVDIAAMLAAGVSLQKGLGAFRRMFKADPALPLRALGFFKDGDLAMLPDETQETLRAARDEISTIPDVSLQPALVG
jgi:predicted nucleotidyltransferase